MELTVTADDPICWVSGSDALSDTCAQNHVATLGVARYENCVVDPVLA
jgi:hypothetical protein